MSAFGFRVRTIYHTLLSAYGPQGWWPGDGAFETIVGAVLTQHTSWGNVEGALSLLRKASALRGPRELGHLSPGALERLIRPAGFPRAKAAALRELVALAAQAPGGLDGLLSARPADLRRTLMAVRGIGPETADSILLYAARRPVFVVDTYARRLVGRHRIASPRDSYQRLQRRIERALPPSARLFGEYHALIVRVGKAHCRSAPRCGTCPLAWDLPARSREQTLAHKRLP
jgi:endonuclease-3 related protein